MVAVTATGGGAIAGLGLIGQAATIQVATATAISEAALAVATAAEVAGACAAAEVALGAAVAAESVATVAMGVTAANLWNPAGWIVGAVLVGASQQASQTVTWGCYKPIIGEIDTKETSTKPITFADLIAHSEVRRATIFTATASANLPEVEVENKAGQLYLLRGVVLPWGSAAYHAERYDEQSYSNPSLATL
ncbi:hypothetical protein EsH8_V_000302 [Colletotrichum jinshuiense]